MGAEPAPPRPQCSTSRTRAQANPLLHGSRLPAPLSKTELLPFVMTFGQKPHDTRVSRGEGLRTQGGVR